ncbi:uracil-DNA glycosylase family protein [Sorangium sp. So ce260]|uniref:uracil-DNA glycosylase n=1 Tax=Sorangium sp. So ce260 TaxID=3133291 RepID=UPI003F628AD4
MTEALREELADLTASVRAFLEWHASTGVDGLPGHPSALHEALGASSPEGGPPAPRRADRGFAGPDAPSPQVSRGGSGAAFAPPAQRSDAAASSPHPEQRSAIASSPHPEQRSAIASSPHPEQRSAIASSPHPEQRSAAASPPHPEQRSAEAQGARVPVQAQRGPEPSPRPAVSAASAPRAEPAARANVAPPDTPEERVARLALIAEEVRTCEKCPLHEGRTHTVFSRGSPLSEVVFVGEGPGAEEDLQGEPFVGPAGQLLDKMISAMGYHRDGVYICNIVKCRPPKNRKPEPAEMAACSPYLASQLALIKPKVIVALGATAVQGLIGTTEGITKLRGTWKLYKGSIPIMPTFHPAYLLRQPSAKREVWSDLKEVMRHLGKSAPDRG